MRALPSIIIFDLIGLIMVYVVRILMKNNRNMGTLSIMYGYGANRSLCTCVSIDTQRRDRLLSGSYHSALPEKRHFV